MDLLVGGAFHPKLLQNGLRIRGLLDATPPPLKQVADVEVVWQPAKIFRRDRLKTITVECDIEQYTTPIAVSSEMEAWLQGDRER